MRGRKRRRKLPDYRHKEVLWPLDRASRLAYLDACRRGDLGGMLKGIYPYKRYGQTSFDVLFGTNPIFGLLPKAKDFAEAT